MAVFRTTNFSTVFPPYAHRMPTVFPPYAHQYLHHPCCRSKCSLLHLDEEESDRNSMTKFNTSLSVQYKHHRPHKKSHGQMTWSVQMFVRQKRVICEPLVFGILLGLVHCCFNTGFGIAFIFHSFIFLVAATILP